MRVFLFIASVHMWVCLQSHVQMCVCVRERERVCVCLWVCSLMWECVSRLVSLLRKKEWITLLGIFPYLGKTASVECLFFKLFDQLTKMPKKNLDICKKTSNKNDTKTNSLWQHKNDCFFPRNVFTFNRCCFLHLLVSQNI